MENQGKIIAVLPVRSGTSAKGSWMSQSYVLETQKQYPKKMVFEVFGEDKISQMAIHQGDILTVHFDIDAREYQGKWYNQVRAWKVEKASGDAHSEQSQSSAPAPQQSQSTAQQQPQNDPFGGNGGYNNDLPF